LPGRVGGYPWEADIACQPEPAARARKPGSDARGEYKKGRACTHAGLQDPYPGGAKPLLFAVLAPLPALALVTCSG